MITGPAAEGEVIRARYIGPTDTCGSRILVTWRCNRRRVPFDYAASDAFEAAIERAFGVPPSRLQRAVGARRSNPDTRVYTVTA